MSSARMSHAWVHSYAAHSQLFGILTVVELKKINEDWKSGPLSFQFIFRTELPVRTIRPSVNRCPILCYLPPMWSSGQNSWLQNGEVLRVL
jgi:hypothetical protein